MKRQRGSILAGVVGLSAVISAALAGFLILATNSTRFEADSEAETQLHYAAESAMDLGLRWLRTYLVDPNDPGKGTNWPTNRIFLIPGGDVFTPMDGAWVKLSFSATPGQFQNHKITCFATLGPSRDTLEINYYLALTDNKSTETENGVTLYSLTMGQWRETLHLGH